MRSDARRARGRRLAELERLLDTSPGLDAPMEAFFDLCDEDPGLTADAVPFDRPTLRELVVTALLGAYGARGVAGRPILLTPLRLPGLAFVHGGVALDGRLGAFFLFERRGLGLLGLAEGLNLMRYVRLRAFEAAAPDPSAN